MKKQAVKSISFLLVVIICGMISLVGCSDSMSADDNKIASEEGTIMVYRSLLGKEREEIAEAFQVDSGEEPALILSSPVTIGQKELSTLAFKFYGEGQTANLYLWSQNYTSAEELLAAFESIYTAITEEYGAPDTPYGDREVNRYHTSSNPDEVLQDSEIFDSWYVDYGTEQEPDLWKIELSATNVASDTSEESTNLLCLSVEKTSYEIYEEKYGFSLETINFYTP